MVENKFCRYLLPNPAKLYNVKWKQSYQQAHQILSSTSLDIKNKKIYLEETLNRISHNIDFKSHIARLLFSTKIVTIPVLVDHKSMDSVIEYLELLITMFPLMASIKDNDGDLPIHNLAEYIHGAIKSSKFLNLVDALLVANPYHVSTLNHKGLTIAHILCSKREIHSNSYAYLMLSRALEADPSLARQV